MPIFINTAILHNPMFFIFAIIAVGMGVGSLRCRSLSLGASGVLFVAIIFGHFYPEMVIEQAKPSPFPWIASAPRTVAAVSELGLVLFAFAIGMQAGPRFFRVFRAHGAQFLLVGVVTACMASGAAILVTKLFHYPPELGLGLYTGALNCTPALAGAFDTARRVGMDDKIVSVGYGLAYPFAAFFVVLFVQVLPGLLRTPAALAAARAREEEARDGAHKALARRTLRLTNPAFAHKTITEVKEMCGTLAIISRLKRGGVVMVALRETEVELDDVLLAVGTVPELGKLHPLGEQCDESVNMVESPDGDVIYEDLVVSRRDVFGRTIGSLYIWERFHVVVTRIRRDAAEFQPTSGLVLEPGDVLRAVGSPKHVEALTSELGREERRLDETLLLPVAAGIAAGIFLGKIPLPLPGGLTVSLGMAGGPFLIALMLSYLGHIGPISVYVPNGAKFLARDLGLVLFLAGTGAKAGSAFFQVLGHAGPLVIVGGALISLTAVVTTFALTHWVLRWNMLSAAGAISATMFNPPALAAASELTPSPAPSLGFASVYPISMIATIAAAQVLVLLMHAIR